MTTILRFRSDMDVTLIDSMASDDRVISAAKVSTLGAKAEAAATDDVGSSKFIDFLMTGRHGSPFEHAVFTFLITAPIFVWREFMRHRIASYNEESGRYKQLEPVFYVPDHTRNLVQVGKPGAYSFQPGTAAQHSQVRLIHERTSRVAYANYEALLQSGIAREVARLSLPLNIYSSAYVTMNARALMNFLSLRTKSDTSLFPSFPQREIEMVAEQMEEVFAAFMPVTWAAFQAKGRVAP